MQENFVQHVWGLQYFNKTDLKTTQGEPLEIFEPGHLNTDAGPDFSNARIRIGAMQWVGNVEIHLQSSQWHDHHHERNDAYDTVILHVVWTDDKPVVRKDGSRISTLELRGRVQEALIRNYRQLIGSSFDIPCRRSFPTVEAIHRQDMITKAVAGRLERKAQEVLHLLQSNDNSWEETTYQLLAGAFGFKLNRQPFLQLAKAMPLRVLHKHQDLRVTEALLFGQAGFLEGSRGDEYYLALHREYRYLARKYELDKDRLNRSQWMYLRLRPSNFPTVRIAQFAALMHHRRNFFSALLESGTIDQLTSFLAATVSPYWTEHYQFSKPAVVHAPQLGLASAQVIVINTVIPLIAAYARWSDESLYMDRALSWLEELPPEENGITRRWSDLGFSPANSLEAQGQIELFNTFCQQKQCLQCSIGTVIVRPPHEPSPDHS